MNKMSSDSIEFASLGLFLIKTIILSSPFKM